MSEKPKKFLRLPEIVGPSGRLPLSRSTWYRGIANGLYPPPVKLGRISAWAESDIDALIERLERHSRLDSS
jgi:prophage regulatory protein